MRRRFALLVVAAAAVFAGAAVSSARGAVGGQNAYARTCTHPGYVQAHFTWGDRCIRAGQYCKAGTAVVRNTEYKKYGFKCKNGKLRKTKAAHHPPSAK